MNYTIRDELLALQNQIRKHLVSQGHELGFSFTQHFMNRIHTHIRAEHITMDDVRWMCWQSISIYSAPMDVVTERAEGHFVDVSKLLDMPFVIQKDVSNRFDMVLLPKTIIRRREARLFERGFSDGRPLFSVSC